MQPKLTGSMYFVGNLENTRAFYEGLGFKASLVEEDYLEMHLGDETEVHLEFVPISDKFPINELFDSNKSQVRGHGVFQFIRVQNVDDYCRTLQEAGYTPDGPPKNWPWKQREFVLTDPDGYKLIFWQKI